LNLGLGGGIAVAILIISLGKGAALITTRLVQRVWAKQAASLENVEIRLAKFFVYLFLGGSCTMLFVLALILQNSGFQALPSILVGVATFLFFFFATSPKLGLATLVQVTELFFVSFLSCFVFLYGL
jgi:hypothetical protein